MSRRSPFSLSLLLLVAGALLFPASLSADGEPDPLLRLVDRRVGLCVELSQAGDRLSAFAESPLFDRLTASPLYHDWRNGGGQAKLLQAVAAIEAVMDKPFDRFARDVFGDTVVLALFPEAEGRTGPLILTRAVDEDTLRATLDAWNAADRVELVSRDHFGRTSVRRTSLAPDGSPRGAHYYGVLGRTLVLSRDEETVRRALQLAAAATPEESLWSHEDYRRSRAALSSEAAVVAWLDPRAWDHAVLAAEPDSQQPRLAEAWRLSRAVALGVRLEEGLALEGIVHYDPVAMPAVWRRFVEASAGSPEFLDTVPARAVAALGARQTPAALFDLVACLVPGDPERAGRLREVSRGLLLGLDFVDAVLPALGPNWGGYLLHREAAEGRSPVDALVAFEIPPEAPPQGGRPALRAALDNALETLLNLLATFAGRRTPQAPAVHVRQEAGVSIRWLDGVGPFQPAYALAPRFLVVATAPDVISEFLDPNVSPGRRTGAEPANDLPGANQVVTVNVARLCRLIEENRQWFGRAAALSRDATAEEAEAGLRRLEDVLRIVDAAFVKARFDEDRIHVLLGVTASE